MKHSLKRSFLYVNDIFNDSFTAVAKIQAPEHALTHVHVDVLYTNIQKFRVCKMFLKSVMLLQ